MNEIVERVARAIWDLETNTDCPEWDPLRESVKIETRKKARAAIAAMRKPTGAMMRESDTSLTAWQAAIDAALAD